MHNARSILLALLALALTATLVACGDDSGDDPGEATASDTGDAEDAGPVEITHAQGTASFSSPPQRIVTLNVQWTDAVLAMGVEPVGYVLDSTAGEADPYPWQEDRLADAERIDTVGTIPFEQIAALKPDLILATFLVDEEADFARLDQIAPTIGLLGDLQVDPWQDHVETLGEILGQPETADEVIATVEGQVADLAAELPGLEGKTYAAANWVEGSGIYVIADPDDGASRLFYALGMEIDPEILALDEEAVGRVQISEEQVGLLDADLLGILTNGSDPSKLPGWNQLDAVEGGGLIDFSFGDVVGLNTPTPLSLPHVMDVMRPALEAVAQS